MGSKITQNGYTFTYVYTYNGQKPIVEDWSLERLAGYMFLVETHRTRSQKYTKDRTYMNRFGNQVYTFDEMEFDAETNRDLNKLVKRISKAMPDGKLQELWLTPNWNDALDTMESFVKELIADAEKPVTVMGNTYTPDKFLTRPTAEEYATRKPVEEPKPEPKKPVRTSTPKPVSKSGDAIGRYLKFDFVSCGVKKCKVVGIQGRSYICEAYNDDGTVLDPVARVGIGSKRIVEWL